MAVNVIYLLRNRRTPKLYESGVRYQREQGGKEVWLTIPQVLRAGFGDCEDLAAWRTAELIVGGVPAKAEVIRTGPRVFHAVVRLPDGQILDPSIKLGMKRPRKRKR